jgi:hypothetical protein
MAVITWRNIEAPNLGDPSRTFQTAQQSFNAGMATLGDLLKGAQANDEANWQTGKTNNTDAFLTAAMQKYATPEGFKAAVASGELEALRSQYGAQIDLGATRQFLDSRLATLQQRGLAENQYNDAQETVQLRPLQSQAMLEALNGNVGGVGQILEANPALRNRFGADITRALLTRQGEQFRMVNEAEDQRFQREGAARAEARAPLELDQLRASTRASNAAAASSEASSRLSAAQLKAQTASDALTAKLEREKADKILKTGPLALGWFDNNTGAKTLRENLTGVGKLSEDEVQAVVAAAGAIQQQGGIPIKVDGKTYRAPISISEVVAAATTKGSDTFGSTWRTDGGTASDIIKLLQKRYENKDFALSMLESMGAAGIAPGEDGTPAKARDAGTPAGRGAAPLAAAPMPAREVAALIRGQQAKGEYPGVKLPEALASGDYKRDKAFVDELTRRAKTMVPGVVIGSDGKVDLQRSDPDTLKLIRQQVDASLRQR